MVTDTHLDSIKGDKMSEIFGRESPVLMLKSDGKIPGWALRVRTPYTFTIWSWPFRVGLELQRGTFKTSSHYWFIGPEVSLTMERYFSWAPPLTINVVVGSLGQGYGISSGGELTLNDLIPFSLPIPVEMVLGISAVLATNIDGQGSRTGFIEGNLTAKYSLPF